MEFYDFQLRAWVSDQCKTKAAVLVHSSPAGAMERPETVSLNWEKLSQFNKHLTESEVNAYTALQEGGKALADAIFPDDVTSLLLRSLKNVSRDDGLRVRLCLDSTLSDLPWEYLFLSQVGGFLAIDKRFSLVREAPLPGLQKPLPREKRSLLFYGVRNCTPDGLDQWQTLEDRDELLKALQPAGTLLAPRTVLSNETDCKTALLNSKGSVDIFHYSGHTDVEDNMGYLIANEIQPNTLPTRLNADALGQLLQGTNTTLAVFSACNSGNWLFVEPLLRSGIPVIVSARGLVYVQVAARFYEKLYKALAIGLSLDEAVSWARAHLLEPGVLPESLKWQWGTFIVYMQTEEAVLFPSTKQPDLVSRQDDARKERTEAIAKITVTNGGPRAMPDWRAIDKSARKSILFIRTIIQRRDGTDRRELCGTGFVIKDSGWALTAAHVVPEPGNDEIGEYQVGVGSRYSALSGGVEVVNKVLDVALLRLPALITPWEKLSIGDSENVSEMDELYTLGFPLNADLSGMKGDLSNSHGPKGLWQTTIPIEHGNSGGPVLNGKGEVVAVAISGIDSAKAMTFVTPINLVRALTQ
jgi:hypothetical protein